MAMAYFAIRATETWSFGNVLGALVLLAAVIGVVVWTIRVTGDRYDR